jgi:MFS family permease
MRYVNVKYIVKLVMGRIYMSDYGSINNDYILWKKKFNYGWILVIIMLIAGVINFLDRVNLSIGGTTIASQFHLNSIQMGVLYSAFLWPYALANLPAGWIVDKFGPKRLFIAATILWSLATLLGGISQNFSQLYASRIMLGIVEAPFFIVGAKVTQMWFAEKDRGLPTGVINTGSQLANAIAPPLLTVILLNFGWRAMFIVIGILGLVMTLTWIIFYREPEKNLNLAKKNLQEKKKKISWGVLLKNRSTWAMMVGNFGLVYVFWVYLTWLPTYLTTQRHFSMMKTGWVAAIPYLTGVIGVPLGGLVSDYLIKKLDMKPIKARKCIIVAAAMISAIIVAPVAYIENQVLSIALLSCAYFFGSTPNGVVWTLATDVAPAKLVGSLGALQNFSGYLGASLAPIVTGFIVQKTGSFNNVFVVSSLFLIMSAIIYGVFLKEKITDDDLEKKEVIN